MAQVEPLPLVPLTVTTGHATRASRFAQHGTHAVEAESRSPWDAASRDTRASSGRLAGRGMGGRRGSARMPPVRGCRLAQEQREQARELVAQLAAIDDEVERALLQQELRALEPSGSFSRTVCSITRGPAKPISAPGSASTRSATNANDAETPPIVGSGEDRHERQVRLVELLQHRRGLRHLEQGAHALLHARAADADTQTNGTRCSVRDATPARTARRPPSPSSRP